MCYWLRKIIWPKISSTFTPPRPQSKTWMIDLNIRIKKTQCIIYIYIYITILSPLEMFTWFVSLFRPTTHLYFFFDPHAHRSLGFFFSSSIYLHRLFSYCLHLFLLLFHRLKVAIWLICYVLVYGLSNALGNTCCCNIVHLCICNILMYDCNIYLFLDPQHFLYFLVDPQSQRSLGFCFVISLWLFLFLSLAHFYNCSVGIVLQ